MEAQQGSLNKVLARFETLYTFIEKQYTVLKTDHALIDNSLIDHDTNESQNELRQQMEQAEKFYLEVNMVAIIFYHRPLRNKNNQTCLQ